MRQAGLKPKSHSSGVYWVRASANPNEGKGRSRYEDGDPSNIISAKGKFFSFFACLFGLIAWVAFTFIFF